MSLKIRSSNKAVRDEFCNPQPTYVKLKVDENISGTTKSRAAPRQVSVIGDQLTRTDECSKGQGHGLTGAFARPKAYERSWAGVLMSNDGFEDAHACAGALGFGVIEDSELKCRFDYSRYEDFFDDLDVSDSQKEQIIGMIIHIGLVFYDMGFGLEVSGQACGKLDSSEDEATDSSPNMVSSAADTLTKTFNLSAAE